MIGDLKPYPDYRDSGLPWLGQVPAHWRTVRNGSLFGQRSQSGYAELPILEVSLKTGVRVRSFGKAGRKQVMSDLGKYKRAVKGDLAYNTMRMWQGALGVCPADGLVSPAYVVARPYPQVDAGYFAALFRTGDYMAEIDSASRGIVKDRNRLYWDQFKQMRSPCPPLAEQVAIMRFLDWANSRLNRAIRAKRKVITLLNEQRQAIIHRAVTRGIDASVALKPSGISWFDKMPAHWDIRRLTSLATFGAGRAHEQFLTPTGQYVCVTARFVSTSGRSRKFSSKNFSPATRRDVLMVMSDLPNGRALGRSYLVADDAEYAVNQRVCRLTPHLIEPRLLAYFANRNFHLLRRDDGMNQTHLSNYDFKTMPVLVPPPEEQIAISDYLDRATSEIDALANRLNHECDLLSEYRARLVVDVVTGRLDIRVAATRLSDKTAFDSGIEPFNETDGAELTDEDAEA